MSTDETNDELTPYPQFPMDFVPPWAWTEQRFKSIAIHFDNGAELVYKGSGLLSFLPEVDTTEPGT